MTFALWSIKVIFYGSGDNVIEKEPRHEVQTILIF